MTKVPAGSETGVYHIPVSGLPWKCSWQRLKDFARNQQPDGTCIGIDHAVVFPNTTDGWVRVKGKSEFRKALKHLSGGVMDGKCLIAFGRNENEEINLRDMLPHVPSSHSPEMLATRSRHESITSMGEPLSPTFSRRESNASLAHSNGQQEWPSTTTSYTTQLPPTFSPVSYFQPAPTPIYESVYPTTSYGTDPSGYYTATTAAPSMVLAGAMSPATPVYVQPATYTYMVPVSPQQYPEIQYTTTPQLSHHPASSTSSLQSQHTLSSPHSHPVVKTEARKIIITHLPYSYSESKIKDLVLRAGKDQNVPLDRRRFAVELARHSDGSPKGHAFAVMESHSVAKKVVAGFERITTKAGQSFKARLAKEGERMERGGYPAVAGPGPGTHVADREVERVGQGVETLQLAVSRDEGNRGWKGKERDGDKRGENGGGRDSKMGREMAESVWKERQLREAKGTPLVVDGTGRRKYESGEY